MLGVKCLADATPAALEEFVARAGAGLSADSAVVLKRARHVVLEIGRVASVVEALRVGDLAAAGRMLTASHLSSKELFENSTPELDLLAAKLSATPHVYGARLTGGGFGGAVMAFADLEFGEAEAESVSAAYAAKYGTRPAVLRAGTSDGAQNITASLST